MTPLGCVTGRFQPVHAQHLTLFEWALDRCEHLIVAVTNPDPRARHEEPSSPHRHTATANPFTYFERVRLLEAAVQERGWSARVTTVPFDLTAPASWPDYVPLSARQVVRAYSAWERHKASLFERANYSVTLLEGDSTARISAGDIRTLMRAGDSGWRPLVPAPTVPLLEDMLSQRSMGDRL